MLVLFPIIIAVVSRHIGAIEQHFDCVTMSPLSITGVPEKKPSPFEIHVLRGTYYTGDKIEVKLLTNRPAKLAAFFVQARRVSKVANRNEPVGYWISSHPGLTTKLCTGGKFVYGDAIRNSEEVNLSNLTLIWRAPPSGQGHIQFKATFVDEQGKFWVREYSSLVRDPTDRTPIPEDVFRRPSPPINPIHTDVCGKEKGCYRVPHGCWEQYCDYIFTWKDLGDEIEFEMSAFQDGNDGRYVAAALSNDTYMGDDTVMECFHDAQTGKVEVFLSAIPHKAMYTKRLPNPKLDIVFEEGAYYHNRLRCRFRRGKYLGSHELIRSLTSPGFHILMARGHTKDGELERHEIVVGNNYPVASPDAMSLQKMTNIGGRAKYPLVKAHACLMLFAWIFCGTIGLLMVKYYKAMWPNSEFYGERYWFTTHRTCLLVLAVAVVIGFIIIFAEVDGYSEYPDLPGKAHPILGIIVFICVIINPILGFLRPGEDHSWRVVFNWTHFLFGLIANILAVVNIFIGMEFGKVNVPAWATWIVMFYFLFNLIVEVSLEVHQCWTHKKNKERMKKWELEKKEYPKLYHPKPHPVGHRFKRNMLFVHVAVTTVVTIILVITFAVC